MVHKTVENNYYKLETGNRNNLNPLC